MEITFQESQSLPHPIYIDVRAPIEFNKDHIPGAINVPLFTDEERSVVGSVFKTNGIMEAVHLGSRFAGNKLEHFVRLFSSLTENGQAIVNCKMGGMRSTSLVMLLRSLGIPVLKLTGGYKAYRAAVRRFFETFEPNCCFIVLHGLAGVGKTRILQYLEGSIDLERIAGHRSSLFGGLGRQPNSQKMFESLLKIEYEKNVSCAYLILEGESRKIGNLHIPHRFYAAMKQGKNILITAPMENRIRMILDDYANVEKEKVIEIIGYLEKKIGKVNVDILKRFLDADDLENFVQFLLEKYYDPLYSNTIRKMNFAAEIYSTDVKSAAERIVSIIRDC